MAVTIALPENYDSLEQLARWMRTNIPHTSEYKDRWQIRSGDPWHIWFADDKDATLFTLLWT